MGWSSRALARAQLTGEAERARRDRELGRNQPPKPQPRCSTRGCGGEDEVLNALWRPARSTDEEKRYGWKNRWSKLCRPCREKPSRDVLETAKLR